MLKNPNENQENFKHQNPNIKRFDKLTTLSQVEGQIPMTQMQNSKHMIRIDFAVALVMGVVFGLSRADIRGYNKKFT